MTDETRTKIYRAVARLDLFLHSCSTSLLCFIGALLLAIAGLLEFRQSRLGASLLWAVGGVAAFCGIVEWKQTGRKQ